MIKIHKYGAIDIGSNAVRLLIASVIETPGNQTLFKKTSLVRVPIRLGEDVFENNKISTENAKRLIDAMNAFKLLIKTHKVMNFRACATSAMREATNGQEIVAQVKEASGIDIQIIDGNDEAAIIASTDINSIIENDKPYLYVDVGGGSTEFTVFYNGMKWKSVSFKIGTVRLLKNLVEPGLWNDMQHWIETQTRPFPGIALIGSGGNINSIFKQSGKPPGKPLSYLFLNSYYEQLQKSTYEDRVLHLNMNPDRADVIIHATKIYLSAMKWSHARKIYVPKIGLSDGIVKSLYYEEKANKLSLKS